MFEITNVGSAICREGGGSGTNFGAVSGFGGTGFGVGRGGEIRDNQNGGVSKRRISKLSNRGDGARDTSEESNLV